MSAKQMRPERFDGFWENLPRFQITAVLFALQWILLCQGCTINIWPFCLMCNFKSLRMELSDRMRLLGTFNIWMFERVRLSVNKLVKASPYVLSVLREALIVKGWARNQSACISREGRDYSKFTLNWLTLDLFKCKHIGGKHICLQLRLLAHFWM